ncbi:MAG: TetR/AcrR family transcriptional regulator [Pseudomonadales bacterium]|nr:TetR/AcrR family transcriptional regulator [Pseudomonadales bacterium]
MKRYVHSEGDPLPHSVLLKIPRQPRSIEMVHCILNAGMDVIRDSGLQAMTTNRVAEQAGISIGSLYQYFANRDSILTGIIERSLIGADKMLQNLQVQQIDLPPEQLLKSGLLFMLQYYEPYLEVARPILRDAPLLSEKSAATLMERVLSDMLRNYMLNNSDKYRLVNGHAGLYVAVNSGIYLYLKWILEPSPFITQEQFTDTLVNHLMAAIEEV